MLALSDASSDSGDDGSGVTRDDSDRQCSSVTSSANRADTLRLQVAIAACQGWRCGCGGSHGNTSHLVGYAQATKKGGRAGRGGGEEGEGGEDGRADVGDSGATVAVVVVQWAEGRTMTRSLWGCVFHALVQCCWR